MEMQMLYVIWANVIYYEESAEKGYSDAQVNLGSSYYYGHGVEKDPKKAIYWYQKAAINGNADALCNLGQCYQLGVGDEKDEIKAFKYYEESAEKGHVIAQVN